ncbi:aaa central region [Chrysochromulina tobinii]|uniref:Aaa central region n=1 Tax=Chrysochromulina tobinii TaxID=1460289 RepID=A0A0M0K4P9_9EUKA|nr:aaa central region [Chrysochromulina tobinii]|eukprot:KOO33353.1 aaa central region [Chrysochromulina sp. CCMP291]
MLPVTARRKAERAVAAVLASQWETAADMFDEARDAANAEPSATAAAAALDVMYAFALASDPTSRDKAEAWSVVHEYARKVTELQLACEPLLLLVLARLEHGDVTHAAPPARSRQRSADSYAFLALFAHKTIGIAAEGVGVNGDGGVNGHGGACFSVELGLTGRSVLTELELREIREADEARELELISDAQRQGEASSSVPILPSRSWSGALGPEARWQRKADEASSGDGDPTLPSSALDTLMALRGLHHVKNIALELHTRVMAERRLPPAMRVKTSLNFSLMGNPGTGKTTVAKLLGQLLHELGLRSSTTFVSTSGEAMLRECPKKIPGLIASADNGVLFIDEAYQLDPAKNSEGKAIVNQLLTAAEEKRETLSIIFAGYKDDTEEKLYAYGFNPGLKSRFRDILFEDFTQPELKEIFVEFAEKHKWTLDTSVAEVASRRVARRRGVKGFANARDVRTLFEHSYTRATNRIDAERRAEKRKEAAQAAATALATALDQDAVQIQPSAITSGSLPERFSLCEAAVVDASDMPTFLQV